MQKIAQSLCCCPNCQTAVQTAPAGSTLSFFFLNLEDNKIVITYPSWRHGGRRKVQSALKSPVHCVDRPLGSKQGALPVMVWMRTLPSDKGVCHKGKQKFPLFQEIFLISAFFLELPCSRLLHRRQVPWAARWA